MQKETNKEIERIIEEFKKRFANPTAKYLGNDFNDYPKANIKDATEFLRAALFSYRNDILNEERKWKQGEEKHCIGAAIPVYGVVDKDNQILTEQLPFYFRKDYAISAVKQMNEHISHKEKKPYKVKKGYLFYNNGSPKKR